MTDDDDNWLPFHFAAMEIKAARGVSLGKAKAMLRELCASEIGSRKQPYSIVNGEPRGEGPPEPIAPHEWREHAVDMMADDDGCNYFVDVNVADFRYSLKLKQKQKRPAVGKQPRILKLLAEKFQGKRVPDPAYCPRDELRADLLKRDPSLEPLHMTTLKTAIDTYNADPKRS
jgi:hypothetical protein